jgi:long-chain acyl-CoA synthetase
MLPSAHMYGMMFEFLYEMTCGMHVHFLSRVPSPKIIMKAFSEIHPDIIIAVPLVMEKVYKTKLKPLIDRRKIKLLMSIPVLDKVIAKRFCTELTAAFGGQFEEVILGGAAFNPEVEQFLHRIGFHYTVGYGMTECAPIIGYAHWNKVKVGSAGRAAKNMQIRIDSPDPRNIPGEVQVSGPNVCLGYFKNEQATRDSFTEDGWFRTGDMGIIDEDGYLFLRGRSKCMILGPSGQNIYPEELEAVINNYTYVVDSLVVEDDGGLTALIYPDWHQGELDGMTRDSLKERLLSVLPDINSELPKYAQIRKVEFMPEDFERTPKKSIKRYLYQRN